MNTANTMQSNEIKSKLKNIYLYIVWGKFSNTYFQKSSSWLYNKLNGRDGNGGEGKFTKDEVVKFKTALLDFSDEIRSIAEKL